MISKQLKKEDLQEFASSDTEEAKYLTQIAEMMEKGERVVAKLVITAAECRIDVYKYDYKLYRYFKVRSFVLDA